MLVIKLPSSQERRRIGSSQQIKDVAGDELDEDQKQTVVYLGNGIIGFKEAPTLPDEAADQAFQSVAEAFADRLGINADYVEGMSQSDVEKYLMNRYDGDEDRVDTEMGRLFGQQ